MSISPLKRFNLKCTLIVIKNKNYYAHYLKIFDKNKLLQLHCILIETAVLLKASPTTSAIHSNSIAIKRTSVLYNSVFTFIKVNDSVTHILCAPMCTICVVLTNKRVVYLALFC